MNIRDQLIYGERLGDLAPAILQLHRSMKLGDDGRYRGSFEFEPAVAVPFRRALIRAEAEVLAEEADKVDPGWVERSESQRRVDALLRLVQAAGSASDGSGSGSGRPASFRLPPPAT